MGKGSLCLLELPGLVFVVDLLLQLLGIIVHVLLSGGLEIVLSVLMPLVRLDGASIDFGAVQLMQFHLLCLLLMHSVVSGCLLQLHLPLLIRLLLPPLHGLLRSLVLVIERRL